MAAVLAMVLTVQACGSADSASASSRANSRFFGMHIPGLNTAFPKALRRAVGAVDLTTNGVYWPNLEPSQGTWSWGRLDSLVDRAHSHGAQPMLVLGQTPSWAGATVASKPSMAAWNAYVTAVVKRYKTRLDYEIWPEPNITSNWSGSPRQLARLAASASKIIHRATGGMAVVVSPAMVLRMRYQRVFMDKFFAARIGGKRVGSYVDAVGVDPYPKEKGTPEDSFALIHKARSMLRHHKVKAPLWNVEINYGVIGGHATVARRWSNRKQASYVVRNDMLDAAAGIKRVYWLGWFPFKEATIQFVKTDGVSPTIAAKALGVVRGWLIHQHMHSCAPSKHGHLWSCKLVRSGHASWVYWTTKGRTVVRAPKGSRHVETMLGKTSRTHAGKRLRVTSSPIRVSH